MDNQVAPHMASENNIGDIGSSDIDSLRVLMQHCGTGGFAINQIRGSDQKTYDASYNEHRLFEDLPLLIDEDDSDLQCDLTGATFNCNACLERGLDIGKALGWSHSTGEILWCRDCLLSVIKTSIGGDTRFPPVCFDEQIKLNDVIHILPPKLSKIYEERLALAAMTRPIYCIRPTCSRLLGDESNLRIESQKFATCKDCETSTCLDCREPQSKHNASILCPAKSSNDVVDTILSMDLVVNDLGYKEVHQQCVCGNVMSRRTGCPHVTCPVCLRKSCINCGGDQPYGCTCIGEDRPVTNNHVEEDISAGGEDLGDGRSEAEDGWLEDLQAAADENNFQQGDMEEDSSNNTLMDDWRISAGNEIDRPGGWW